MKYYDLYLAACYDALERGGEESAVNKTIDEINNPTDEGLATWLKVAGEQPCAVCGEPFVPSDHAKLSEEPLCPTHATPT